METIPELSEIQREQPVCDACQAYDCKVKLTGEFQGAYHAYPRPGAISFEKRMGILCILHHQDMAKDSRKCMEAINQKTEAKDADFRGIWHPGDVRFSGELENADFTGSNIGGHAAFIEVTFGGRASFVGTIFGDEAEFNGASFRSSVTFFFVKFGKTAVFNGVHFEGRASFIETSFRSRADFSTTTFAQAASFYNAQFGESVSFHGATFEDRASFVGLGQEFTSINSGHGRDFRGVAFLKPEKVHFRNVDMQEMVFLGTDVREVEFTNVRWPDRLRDENNAEKHVYPLVEKLYRQLRQNYEANGNYPDAGRFYYGEMEMRRKAMPWWQQHFFSLTTLYWLSSGYGQRARQAGLWVVMLFLVFSGLYSIAGLQLVGSSGTASHSLRSAFLHTAEVLTFTRERTYAAATDLGKWLSVLQTVVLPLQVALLVLAVRRSFKR